MISEGRGGRVVAGRIPFLALHQMPRIAPRSRIGSLHFAPESLTESWRLKVVSACFGYYFNSYEEASKETRPLWP